MRTKLNYKCYNLTVHSEIELPEMGVPIDVSGKPDLRIVQGPVSPDGLKGGTQIGPFLWATPEAVQLHVPHVARFLISGGDSIIFDPEPGIDDDSVRVFMLGSALGALLFQRGYLVLHGNAIRIGDACIVCVGHSGAGKSTLAAAFMKRGYQLLADDVVPIDNDCRAIPGFPRIKLWKDAANKLEIETKGLRRIRPDMEKFNLPIADSFVTEPLPVSHIYLLNSDHDSTFTSQSITGIQRFRPLYNNTYRVKFLENMALKPDHLKLCGKLAAQTKLTRVTRPRDGFDVNRLVDHILADMADEVADESAAK